MRNSTFAIICMALAFSAVESYGGGLGRSVTVSAAGQRLAGITTARVRAGASDPGFTVTGRVVQDAQNIFHVKSATGGAFSAAAALGAEVEKGQLAGSVLSDSGETPVTFPARGVVTAAAASGAAVRAGEILYTVTALDPVWAVLDVSEREISRLRHGGKVVARSSSWPGKTFDGEIVFIAPEIDEESRTVKTRARLSNPDGMLKFGLFITADVLAPSGGGASIPADSLQRLPDGWAVFVQTGPELFEVRNVRPGAERNGRVEVLEGLRAGETVAVKGAFLLKSELMKSEIAGE